MVDFTIARRHSLMLIHHKHMHVHTCTHTAYMHSTHVRMHTDMHTHICMMLTHKLLMHRHDGTCTCIHIYIYTFRHTCSSRCTHTLVLAHALAKVFLRVVKKKNTNLEKKNLCLSIFHWLLLWKQRLPLGPVVRCFFSMQIVISQTTWLSWYKRIACIWVNTLFGGVGEGVISGVVFLLPCTLQIWFQPVVILFPFSPKTNGGHTVRPHSC